MSYDFPRSDGLVASGHRLWSQIGTFVVMIEADRVGGAPLQGVTELALAQIACVQAGSCPPTPVPASLIGG